MGRPESKQIPKLVQDLPRWLRQARYPFWSSYEEGSEPLPYTLSVMNGAVRIEAIVIRGLSASLPPAMLGMVTEQDKGHGRDAFGISGPEVILIQRFLSSEET